MIKSVEQQVEETKLTGRLDMSVHGLDSGKTGQGFPPKAASCFDWKERSTTPFPTTRGLTCAPMAPIAAAIDRLQSDNFSYELYSDKYVQLNSQPVANCQQLMVEHLVTKLDTSSM